MKKKILSLMLVFACAVSCFAGCGLGSYIDNNGGNNKPTVPTDPDNPVKPDEPVDPSVPETHYTVSVFYNNKLFDPAGEDITVVWKNDLNVKRVALGADGKADAGELDGDYGVYLEGLPSQYAYNPNVNSATAENRKITILLTDVKQPERGDGKGLYVDGGCYVVRYDGTYRAQISYEGEYLYYQYTPTAAGFYSVESCVNVYSDEINPLLRTYSGSGSYKYNPKDANGGGFSLDGGFTRNFRYECKIDKSEVGHSFTFAVSAQGKNTDYPLTVDFAITYEGEYVSGNSDERIYRAKEAKIKAAEKKPGEKFTFADLGKKQFIYTYYDETTKTTEYNYKYNEDTGFFHYYNKDYADDPYGYGKNYGPILCCAISMPIESYSVTTLYDAHFVGLGQNFLRLYNMWLEEEHKYVVLNYTDFIREDYNRVSNSDGVCYVTKELKDFLQKFAESHSLYTDGAGTSEGTPEEKGYSANQDALWLFACGFYK